jgi:hypothetical protein
MSVKFTGRSKVVGNQRDMRDPDDWRAMRHRLARSDNNE